MALFNYSRLKYFNTKGQELPLVYDAPKVTFVNPRFNDESGEYLVVVNHPDEDSKSFSFLPTKTGKRFLSTDTSVLCKYRSSSQLLDTTITSDYYTLNEYVSSSEEQEHYFRFLSPKINDILNDFGVDNLEFPSLKFTSKIYFNKVSTGLVETESIYILTESFSDDFKTHRGTPKYTTVSEHALSCTNSATDFIERYKLMFFIDCREQSNFRFFTTKDDEIVWSDRKIIDFSADNNYAIGDTNSGYRVDIGFTGDLDGVYEEKLYVFIIDTTTKDTYTNYPGDAYLIGTINMLAETEGEDERYRTFYDNFGIPDPKETYDAFSDTDILQEFPDYIKINDYSKKLYLAYDQIFPYVGTYKALINSLKVLGYDNIFFKEWYKDLGCNSINNNVAFDMPFTHNKNAKLISNVPLEERIQLKKLNWISMVYKISEENSLTIDEYGFPSIDMKDNYYDNGTLVKLISLKNYLEKYIFGVNCRITDISGEGVIFERYNTHKYGSYQQVIDYNNENSIGLRIDNPSGAICDGVATIDATIVTSNSNIPFEDFKTSTFLTYCNGCLDSSGNYHNINDNEFNCDSSSNIYTGKTIELNDTTNRYEIRAIGDTDSFRFNKTSFVTEQSPSLIVDDGKIMFDPKDLLESHRNSSFVHTNLPTIQIKNGYIREIYNDGHFSDEKYVIKSDLIDGNGISYVIEGINQYALKDIPTFLPPRTITRESNHWAYTEVEIKTATNENVSYQIGNQNYESYDIPGYIANETYGLRYTSDNIYNIPVFLMKGYVCSEIMFEFNNQSFPDIDKEYYIEILDGSMIFDDIENDRKISLNFNFDKKTKDVNVSVTTLQHTYIDNIHEYLCVDSSNEIHSTTTLNKDTNYIALVDKYLNFEYDDAIIYNPNIELRFYNTGTYNINVLMFDQCNNVFTSNTNKEITIQTPYIKTTYLTDCSTQGSGCSCEWIYTDDIETFSHEKDGDICIYAYEPKRELNKTSIREQHKTNDGLIDNAIYHLEGCYDENDDSGIITCADVTFGNFAQISNTLDRFVMIGANNNESSKNIKFHKHSTNSGHRKNTIDKNVSLIVYNTASEYVSCVAFGEITNDNNLYTFIPDEQISTEILTNIITECSKPHNDIYIIPCWCTEVTIGFDDYGNNTITIPEQFTERFEQNEILTLYYKTNENVSGATLILIDRYLGNNVYRIKNKVVDYEINNNVYKLYISLVDTTFVSYIMPLNNTSTKNIINGNSREALKISQHIDCGFTASVRDFDVTIGQKWYNNGITLFDENTTNNRNNIYLHTNKIISNGFVAMTSDISKETYYCGCGIGVWDDLIDTLDVNDDTTDKKRTYRWKIYKQSKKQANKKLLVDCFNQYPMFSIDEKGVYDVEAIIYDEHGNKFINKSIGAITII